MYAHQKENVGKKTSSNWMLFSSRHSLFRGHCSYFEKMLIIQTKKYLFETWFLSSNSYAYLREKNLRHKNNIFSNTNSLEGFKVTLSMTVLTKLNDKSYLSIVIF